MLDQVVEPRVHYLGSVRLLLGTVEELLNLSCPLFEVINKDLPNFAHCLLTLCDRDSATTIHLLAVLDLFPAEDSFSWIRVLD